MFSGRRGLFELLPKGLKVKKGAFNYRYYASKENSALNVEIPHKIKRGPTDILRALSETVGRDPTAYHYKYPDDPFIPLSSFHNKKKEALSLESGRRAARWIVSNNPELFQHRVADPYIKAFAPETTYDENSEVNEDILLDVIEEKSVKKAITVYSLCKDKNIDISDTTKQLLLELVCFYNCEDKPDENELDIKWYKGNDSFHQTKSWKDSGFAEELFKTMNQSCPLAISTIILGRLKYNDVQLGYEAYQTANKDNINLNIAVYNVLLERTNSIKEGTMDRINFIKDTLKDMSKASIQPDLHTLNAILKSLSGILDKRIFDVAVRIMGEFIKIGVAPSLGSYHFLLHMFLKRRQSGESLYFPHDLLKEVGNMRLEIRHPSDFLFFHLNMSACCRINDVLLAKKLYSLYWKNGNTKFISCASHESLFYKTYLIVLLRSETIEYAMSVYNDVVPTLYSSDMNIYQDLCSAIRRTEGFSYIPGIWNEIKGNRMNYHALCVQLLEMVTVCKLGKEEKVWETFNEVATSLYGLKDSEENILSDSVISHILICFVKVGKTNEAEKIFEETTSKSSYRNLSKEGLDAFYEFCLTNKQSLIMSCLKYASDIQHPKISEMAEEALPHVSHLPQSDVNWIKKLIKKGKTKQKNNETKDEGSTTTE